MNPFLRWSPWFAVSGLCAACVSTPNNTRESSPDHAQAASRQESFQKVTLELSPDGLRITDVQSIPAHLVNRKQRSSGTWKWELLHSNGSVVDSRDMQAPNVIRGEFAEADGKTTAVHEKKSIAVFQVTIPSSNEPSSLRILAPKSEAPASKSPLPFAGDFAIVGTVQIPGRSAQ